jgi:HlyD family secretion protein
LKKPILIAAAAVVGVGALLVFSLRSGGGEKGTKVYAAKAEKKAIARTVKASGQVDPRVKVNISAHVIGKIEKLFVKEGDRVSEGQPFLQLERQAYLSARDGAAAQREIQRSRLRQAEIALADAKLKLDRMRRLVADKIASSEQLEAVELQHNSSLQQLEQARQGITQAEADLVRTEDELRKTTIYSPLAGKVITLNAEQGEVVVSGTMNNPGSVIGTIADLSEILVEVDVDENEIVFVRGDQAARVLVDAIADHEYTGRVVEIGSSGFTKPAQPDVTFFKVKVLIDTPDDALLPGMSARAEIKTEAKTDAVVVPIQAVVERKPLDDKGKVDDDADEVKVVFSIDAGKVHQRTVKTGISDATNVELISGVEEGVQVVSGPYRALKALKEAQKVQIVEEGKAETDRTTKAGADGKN